MGELASGHCKGQNQSQLIIANASIHTLSAADRQAAVAGGIAKHIALIGGQNHGGTVVSSGCKIGTREVAPGIISGSAALPSDTLLSNASTSCLLYTSPSPRDCS